MENGSQIHPKRAPGAPLGVPLGGQPARPAASGHLFLVLKPNLFVGKNYIKRIKENIRIIKKLPKINGVKEILYPGQGINSRYKRNLKKGIVIPKNILEGIKKLNVIK